MVEEYQKKKRYIKKNNILKSNGIRAGLSVIPVVGSALGILSGTITGNVQADLMELEEEFKWLMGNAYVKATSDLQRGTYTQLKGSF